MGFSFDTYATFQHCTLCLPCQPQVKLLYVLQPMDYKDLTQRLLQSWRFGTLMQRNLDKWMDK